ncbi:lipopolysaccharide biosynthesis protein [Cyclobacterium qasimii]|uniref:Lipopolysaccharide biosynthesis protein n=1 Tax=Cyclobacterium qasimii TaxID=1350429 RepID=A0A512C951_9BACT|nr:lipopolysaccharide biosynthesis protein [Cyclobacterium qasimii]GEO20731.1 lipopolysaccharide biosynthesis protein [Cyclobacterium qasimii]
MSLKKQTLSGILWTFTETFVLRGLSFIASVILARLLGPTEFGLVGMISVFIALGNSFVDSGLSASLIRTKDADETDYATVFYLNLALSIVVYGIFYITAPMIAAFFEQELLELIVRVYCLTFIISAFSAVQLALLNKRMKFKQIMKCKVPGTILGVLVGLWMGYAGFGVWSIVCMFMCTQLGTSVMLWLNSSWTPSLVFSKEKLKYHYNFGYKLMLSGLIDTFYKNVYKLIIGKFFTVQDLGYYERAHSFNNQSVTMFTSIISKVSYPLLSKIQDQKERIAVVYRQLIQFSFFVIAPMMLGAAALAKPLFLLVLGEQWLPAVPLFQILCLSGMFYPVHAFNINVLKVYGRSDLFLKLELIKKAIITISILIGFQFGIYGLVWSSVFTSLMGLMVNTHYSSRMIQYTTMQQLGDITLTMIKAGLMAGLMWGITMLLQNNSQLWQLVLAGTVGVVFYLLLNYALRSPQLFFALDLIKKKN